MWQRNSQHDSNNNRPNGDNPYVYEWFKKSANIQQNGSKTDQNFSYESLY